MNYYFYCTNSGFHIYAVGGDDDDVDNDDGDDDDDDNDDGDDDDDEL